MRIIIVSKKDLGTWKNADFTVEQAGEHEPDVALLLGELRSALGEEVQDVRLVESGSIFIESSRALEVDEPETEKIMVKVLGCLMSLGYEIPEP